jgi:hypothetical protein
MKSHNFAPRVALCVAMSLAAQLAALYTQNQVASATQPVAIATVSLVYDPPHIPLPLVRLSINGREPAFFLLSTGTPGLMVIDEEKATTFGLDRRGDWATLRSVSLVDDQGRPLAKPELGIPAAYVANLQLHKLNLGLDIVGILGANFFAAVPVGLDLRNRLLRLYEGSFDYSSLSKEYVVVKLSRPNRGTWEHCAIVTAPPNQQVQLTIATGAWISTLAGRELKGVEWVEFSHQTFPSMESVEGKIQMIEKLLGRMQWIKIGEVLVREVPFAVTFEGTSVLGMDILSLFDELIVDLKTGHLLLRKPAGELSGRVRGISGLRVEKDTSGKARVGEVFPASAAARAGFQKEDELVAISGRLTQGMSQGVLQLLVDGYAGVAQRVQIVRNGQQMELTLIPETPFQQRASVTIQLHTSRRLGFDAILVNHSNEQYLLVTRIEEEHLKQAGLRVGDLIVSINDRSEWSVEELRGLVERKVPLRLRVRALGESTERVVQLFP